MLLSPTSPLRNGPARRICRRETSARSWLARRGWIAALALCAWLACGRPVRSQEAAGSGDQNAASRGPDQAAPADGGAYGAMRDASGSVPGAAPSMTISSNRIVEILEQNPDLMVELKSLVAERLEEQGVEASADEISDGMFYSEIETNAALRAGIAAYLRARGYLAGDEFLNSETSAAENASGAGPAAQQTPNLADGSFADALRTPDAMQENELTMAPFAGEESGLALPVSPRAVYGFNRMPAGELQPRNGQANVSTEAPKVLRQAAPYNLQSLRDLYTQIPESTERLKRFGSDVFVERDAPAAARGLAGRDTPLDVPLGPDYVLGPGDTLTVDLWGGVTQSITRTVDRAGRLLLPDTAPLAVAGLTLERAQALIEGALKQQYRNAQCAVTATGVRSVRVYVVGDVQRPGGYDISALATPLSALYAAGGPTSAGSLRTLLHYRGKQLVEAVDLYDFLLHGIRNGSERFESGDTLLVPPAGAQVAVSGAVKRPAVYELKAGDAALDAVIADAGGLAADASPGHVRIERIGTDHERETVKVDLAEDPPGEEAGADFSVQDGDRIYVEPILPYSARVVYLEGHVARPGRLAYRDGMRLSDALHSYRDLLPEPAAHGEIVRLVAPDLHAETIAFSVPDVLIGNADVNLDPFDTIRVYGRYEIDAPKVTVLGEVLRPGTYPMSGGMTAAQLVRMAGGFKRDAMLESADLTSYDVVNGKSVAENVLTVQIGAAVSGSDAQADIALKAGDTLMVHQMTGWNEIGQSVTIEGQVKYPGSYGFEDGERLSSVLKRAGGMLPDAYPMGAVLEREQVKELEQKSRDELIRQIETSSAAARLSPTVTGTNAGAAQETIKAQQEEVIAELKSHPPAGRMVIQISADIDRWAGTAADIELRRGDVVTIPKRPGFVLVTGQVYNATALTFTPDKTAGWYLSRAGGASASADRKEIFIIRANGSVIGRRSGGWLGGDVLATRLNPGDVVVVPQKIIGASALWRNLLVTGQLAASVALTAGVAAAAL